MQKWVQTLTGLMMSAFLALGLGAKARAQTPEDALPENAPVEAVAPAEEDGSAAAQNQTQQEETIPETDGEDTIPETQQQETTGSSAGTDVTTPEAAGTDSTAPSVGTEIPGTAGTSETLLPPAPADETAVPAASVPGQGNPSLLSDSAGMTRQAVVPAPAADGMITLSAPLDTTSLRRNAFVLTSVGSAPAPAGSSGEDDTDSTASGTPVITVGSTEVDGSQDVTGTNWRYLAESGRLVMVNYDGSAGNVVTGENGASILAAGINRIGTLSCSGDVVILGTGILLVDNVQMIGESTLSLQTNTDIYADGTGSVAMFLKQEDGTYLLVNGDVTGILDECYELPDNVTLVVPEDSSLSIQSIWAKTVTDSSGGTTVSYTTQGGENTADTTYEISSASLSVNKLLSSGAVYLRSLTEGDVYAAASLFLRGTGSVLSELFTSGTTFVDLGNNTTVENLTASGKTTVVIHQNETIGNVTITTGGEVTVYPRSLMDEGETLHITGKISGGNVLASGGHVVLGPGATFSNGGGVTGSVGNIAYNPVILNNSSSIQLPDCPSPTVASWQNAPKNLREQLIEQQEFAMEFGRLPDANHIPIYIDGSSW